ncbi:MAG: hypothetical protein WCW26_02325 [Candidatus Buchananbacteria bacterium]
MLLVVVDCSACKEPMLLMAPPMVGVKTVSVNIYPLQKDKLDPSLPIEERVDHVFEACMCGFKEIFAADVEMPKESAQRIREAIRSSLQVSEPVRSGKSKLRIRVPENAADIADRRVN